MKKECLLFGLFVVFFSCSKMDEIAPEIVDKLTTRTAGDAVFDVLGYGYDITGEYLVLLYQNKKVAIFDLSH